uniref:Uncharacterized protein n=1 Tax=Arundo donax TaxID=35708 RepID=A0A0A9EVT6_ARUDO
MWGLHYRRRARDVFAGGKSRQWQSRTSEDVSESRSSRVSIVRRCIDGGKASCIGFSSQEGLIESSLV